MITAYEGKEPYIFVSYAHVDSPRVLPVIESLQRAGFRVWYDAGIEAGTEWPEYIAEHLLGCGCVLAFITQAALESKNCRQEINFAIDEDKPLLAAYLEACTPTAGMRMRLNSLQAIHRDRHASDAAFLTALSAAALLQPCLGIGAQASPSAEELFRQGEAAYDAQNYGEAVSCYREAAAQGHPAAQCRLGQCLEEGTGAEKDPQQAVAWYQEAADKENAWAQYHLGRCFANGTGIGVNLDKAVSWYRKAAEQGNAEAQLALGQCFETGKGVGKDETQAVSWYEKAAQQGHADAQYALAMCYAFGCGVEENRSQALGWCMRAANNGSIRAKQELINLL